MVDDPDGGDRGKRDGMARADEHANEEWKRVCDIAIRAEARRRRTLTTDHVWAHLREHYPNHHTHENRAMGARMNAAAKAEILERIYETSKSAMSICHSRDKNVWRSKAYEGPGPRFKVPRRKPFDPRQFDLFTASRAAE